MKTFEEQKAFFDEHWDSMKAAVESGGGKAVGEFIGGFEDDLERRVLYMFARTGLVMRDWEGKSFDPYIEVCDAGIAEVLRQAEALTDEEERAKRKNGAHVISFNLAADLAECWPGDDAERTREQLVRGAKAAEDCLEWCQPHITAGFARDWWILGMHQLSLGDADAARTSFESSFDYAQKVAREQEMPEAVGPDAGFGVIVGSGYVGLARLAAGDERGREQYDGAIAAFREQTEDADKKDDAAFGIAQLEKVREKFTT